MKISTKGLYAVRFMVFLAGHGGTEPVPLKEIAEATSISRKYLEQIASSLAAAQLVRSARGASGGYRLARSATNITMLDVLTVTEGSLAPVDYLDELSGGSVSWRIVLRDLRLEGSARFGKGLPGRYFFAGCGGSFLPACDR